MRYYFFSFHQQNEWGRKRQGSEKRSEARAESAARRVRQRGIDGGSNILKAAAAQRGDAFAIISGRFTWRGWYPLNQRYSRSFLHNALCNELLGNMFWDISVRYRSDVFGCTFASSHATGSFGSFTAYWRNCPSEVAVTYSIIRWWYARQWFCGAKNHRARPHMHIGTYQNIGTADGVLIGMSPVCWTEVAFTG